MQKQTAPESLCSQMLQSIKTANVTVCGTQSTAIVESSLHPLILKVMTHDHPPFNDYQYIYRYRVVFGSTFAV